MSDQDQDQSNVKVTALIDLPNAPSERMKAGARLAQAAMLMSMDALQQVSRTLAAVADVNDLSYRRGEGRIDLSSSLFDNTAGENFNELLLEAALAYAEAADAERVAEAEAVVEHVEDSDALRERRIAAFETIGCALSALRRLNGFSYDEDIRESITHARSTLSAAQSKIKERIDS